MGRLEFHIDQDGRFISTTEEQVIDDVLYHAYKCWDKQFDKKTGMNIDGLLRMVMDEEFEWGYDNSSELNVFIKSVLENAMTNHKTIARYFKAVENDKKTSIVLKYADGSPMKEADIAFLHRFYQSGAFDKVDLE